MSTTLSHCVRLFNIILIVWEKTPKREIQALLELKYLNLCKNDLKLSHTGKLNVMFSLASNICNICKFFCMFGL
jgi:hypothetical protein